MNFSGFLVVAAAMVLVVSGQQSDHNARNSTQRALDAIAFIKKSSQKNIDNSICANETISLRDILIYAIKEGIKCTDKLSNAISSAKEKVVENPEAAKKEVHQAFGEVQVIILSAIVPYLKVYGKIMVLSNDSSIGGLESSKILQIAGLGLMDELNEALSFFDQGLMAGGNATLLLVDALSLGVDTGFAACYQMFEKSIEVANKALRDACSRPVQPPVSNPNCEALANDTQSAGVLSEIDEAANSAISRGANSDIVNDFKQNVICLLGELLVIGRQGKRIVESSKAIAKIQPVAGEIAFLAQIESVKTKLNNLFSIIIIAFADVGLKSGKESSQQMQQAITAVELGKVEIFTSIKACVGFISFGTKFEGDAVFLAYDAASKSGYYGNIALRQGLVNASKALFSVI